MHCEKNVLYMYNNCANCCTQYRVRSTVCCIIQISLGHENQGYRDVATALRRTRGEDEEAGTSDGGREGAEKMRSAMWMGDHNMVIDPAVDELRGSQAAGGATFRNLLTACGDVRELLGGTYDVIRELRGARVKAFTHRAVRRTG